MDTIVIWLGSLAILLNKLWGTIFRPEKINCTFEETVKRYACNNKIKQYHKHGQYNKA
jgi:hypothetical protein